MGVQGPVGYPGQRGVKVETDETGGDTGLEFIHLTRDLFNLRHMMINV